MSDQPIVDTLRHNFENAKDRIQQLEDGRLAERRQIANLQGEIKRLTDERDAWSVRAGLAEAQAGELLTETRAEIVRLTEDRDHWRQYALEAKAKWEARALEAQAALVALQQRYDALTGDRFSDRVHEALKARAERAEDDCDALAAELRRERAAHVDDLREINEKLARLGLA